VDAIFNETNMPWQLNCDLAYTEDSIIMRLSVQLLIWCNPVRPFQTWWSSSFWY